MKRPRHAHETAPAVRAGVAVITVSDTRDASTDASGDAVAAALVRARHEVVLRRWVRDRIPAVRAAVRSALARRAVDAVVLTGGSGIAPRDRTPEAVRPLLARELPGFGELFRMLSYRQVGGAAWLSRAGAGVARGRLVVWLPGSTRAVQLAMRSLVVPELSHALRLLDRQGRSA